MVDIQGFLNEMEALSNKYGVHILCDGLGRKLMYGSEMIAQAFRYEDGHYVAEAKKCTYVSEVKT